MRKDWIEAKESIDIERIDITSSHERRVQDTQESWERRL